MSATAAMHERFVAAHRALLADGTIQFDLTPALPPPQPPHWVSLIIHYLEIAAKPFGRLLHWLGGLMPNAPYARILLWTALASVALAAAWLILIRVHQYLARDRAGSERELEETWRLDEATVRTLLADAEALAVKGHFGEAVHLLLRRSIEDIAGRDPRLIRPALTSRDIATSRSLPAPAREGFHTLACMVERSLFGGWALSHQEWLAARASYHAFALPQAWQ